MLSMLIEISILLKNKVLLLILYNNAYDYTKLCRFVIHGNM